MVSATFFVHMKFFDAASDWTDVTTDVRTGVRPYIFRGLEGTGPLDRVAGPSLFRFALDNSGVRNAAGKISYYSPAHPNCRPGFGYNILVRCGFVYSGTTYYKFTGRLDVIRPIPGPAGERLTFCTAVGWMDDATRFKLRPIAVQINKRDDQILTALLASMPVQPAATDFDTGIDTYAYALDGSQDERGTAKNEFQKVAQSGLGFIWEKGDGTLVYENRHIRAAVTTNASTLEYTMNELDALSDRDELLNTVRVLVRPRDVETAESIIFHLTAQPTIPSNGGSIEISCPYRDPDQTGQRIGAYDVDVTLTAGVDWIVISDTDGTSDLTAFCTLAFVGAGGANSSTVLITNNHPTHEGRVTKLELRGKPLKSYAAEGVWLMATDDVSRADKGESGVTFEMPYQGDVNVGQGAADWILNLNSDPRTPVRKVGFFANHNAAQMTAAMAREISDRVGLVESVIGATDTDEWSDQVQDISDTARNFRDTSSNQRLAQGFKANPGEITHIDVSIQRFGTPSGVIYLQIESDSAGEPSGVSLAKSVELRSIDIPTTGRYIAFHFPTPYNNASAATQYHWVLYSTTTVNASNYFSVVYQSGSGTYANGVFRAYNGSAWSTILGDAKFKLWVARTTSAAGYFINAIEYEVDPAERILCRWTVVSADRNRYWVLGTSVLGADTRLAPV